MGEKRWNKWEHAYFEHARVPNPGFSTILSALTELGLSLDVRKTPQPTELYEW